MDYLWDYSFVFDWYGVMQNSLPLIFNCLGFLYGFQAQKLKKQD